MRTGKLFVLALSLLALIAVGGRLLVWGLPILRAAQESDTKPQATLLIVRHPPQFSFSSFKEGSSAGDSIENYQSYLKTQSVLIKSRLVLSVALGDHRVSQLLSIKNQIDPMAWLQHSLEVTNPKDTDILHVSLAPASGASGTDQAAIINAIVQAYLNEVVNADLKRQVNRLNLLRKLEQAKEHELHERRETLRKLSFSEGEGAPTRNLEKDALPRLYHDLKTQRVKLRLERSEAETLMARRKGVPAAATDQVRSKEIAQFEDRLAVMSAGQKVLDEELERLSHEMGGAANQELDRKAMNDDIARLEEVSRKIGSEVEALNVQLQAPPRIRVFEEAAPARP